MSKTRDVHAAAEPYIKAFQAFTENGAQRAPGWLRERRNGAIERFAELGFPNTRQEAWRFTDVKPIVQTTFALAETPDVSGAAKAMVRSLLPQPGGPVAVFVNGSFVESLSTTAGLPAGVELGGLDDTIASGSELAKRHLGQYADPDQNPFTALNTAFMKDGAFVHVPADTVMDQPLHLLFLAVPDPNRTLLWHPRNLVIADRGARVSLIERYVTVAPGNYWTNAVTEVVGSENTRIETYRVQHEADGAYHTASTHSHQARDSQYTMVNFAFGSRLSRQDIKAVLDGEGAECVLDGLSILRDRQHVDFHTTLEHAKPHCNSWEFFNGVFDDRARGVFTGRIIVRPGAQRTDSKQTNNNLLLSERARADSQPQLEIYADDVKCTHGATLGPIDDKQLFYLQSRGLDREAARSLLTYGFCAEVLSAVKLDRLRAQLDRLVRERLQEGAVSRAAG